MTSWPSTKARRVYAALLAVGWQLKRQSGSHRTLSRDGYPDFVFAFHDRGRSRKPDQLDLNPETHRKCASDLYCHRPGPDSP